MSDQIGQCASEEPVSGKRCALAFNHAVHRNGANAWATDHDAKKTEIDRLSDLRDTTEHHPWCMCRACYWQRRAEKAEAERDALLKKRAPGRAKDTEIARLHRLAEATDEVIAERAERAEDTIARVKALAEQARGVSGALCCCASCEDDDNPNSERHEPTWTGWDLDPATVLAALDQPDDQEGTDQ